MILRTRSQSKPRKRSVGRPKRGQGRPQSNENAVGRDALIASTVELLKLKPHTQINRLEIARFAGVDPALIRYYFGDVEGLLGEVAVKITVDARANMTEMPSDTSIEGRLRGRIRRIVKLFLDYPHLHDLVLDIFFVEENKPTREHWRDNIRQSVKQLDELLREGAELGIIRYVEPRYLHLIIIGASEFLVSGGPLLSDMFGRKVQPSSMHDTFVEFFTDLLLNGLKTR